MTQLRVGPEQEQPAALDGWSCRHLQALLDRYLAGPAADPEAITAAVAAVAGLFTSRALQPPPPGLPTLRAFHAAQGVVARRWLAERTGWE